MPKPLLAAMLGGLLAAFAAVPAFANDPLPRFEDPLCPGVAGLELEAAAMVVGRIRDNAGQFGLRMAADGDCVPNLILAFVPDGRAFLERLQVNEPILFAQMAAQERRELLADTGPARAVLTTAARSRDGMSVPRRENLTDIPQAGMWSAHSRIYTPTRSDILSALVLIDSTAVEGRSLTQMADYATLRALAPASLLRFREEASIISLFDGEGEAPAEMTAADRALLTQLYRGPPNIGAAARIAGVDRAVRKAGD